MADASLADGAVAGLVHALHSSTLSTPSTPPPPVAIPAGPGFVCGRCHTYNVIPGSQPATRSQPVARTANPTPNSTPLRPWKKRFPWYVVIVGRNSGVFDDWDNVRPLISDPPGIILKGAVFRGYNAEQDAVDAFNQAAISGNIRILR